MCIIFDKFGRPLNDSNEGLETLKLRYEFLKEVYEAENQRRRTVEQKASMLIGSLSMMGAVIVGIANLYSNNITSVSSLYIVFYTTCLALNLCMTLYYAIKTIKKGNMALMDTNDQVDVKDKKSFYKKMIMNLDFCIEKNKIVCNHKVDSMEMSQRWFYCVLLSIAFYFILMFIEMCYDHNILNLYQKEVKYFILTIYIITAVVIILDAYIPDLPNDTEETESDSLTKDK